MSSTILEHVVEFVIRIIEGNFGKVFGFKLLKKWNHEKEIKFEVERFILTFNYY